MSAVGTVVQDIPLKDILSDPTFNCRQEKIVPYDVQSLAENIKLNGLTQPVIIQPWDKNGFKYRIVVGHRRHQAFLNLKYERIPAIVRDDLDDNAARVLNITENIERKDLNIYQEAKAIEYFYLQGKTINEISDMLGVSTGWVQIRLTVLKLPFEIQQEVAAGFLNQTHIKDIYSLHDRDKMFAAVRELKDRKLRNEKKIIIEKPKKKINPTRAKVQQPSDLYRLQDYITDTLGPNLATRVLAWAGGVITTEEVLTSVAEECAKQKITYNSPDWVE
jgi:ParB/RepB/Spo0J family partition protein